MSELDDLRCCCWKCQRHCPVREKSQRRPRYAGGLGECKRLAMTRAEVEAEAREALRAQGVFVGMGEKYDEGRV